MKTYPYIGQCYSVIALFYAEGKALLVDDSLGLDEASAVGDKLNLSDGANITSEYLANTYGEVASPEHAEFIIELAENAGFGVSGLTARSMCFEFSGDCNVVFYEIPVDIFANNEESKKITIPLPPKAESKKWNTDFYELRKPPKHFYCVCNKCGGKCCTGQCDKQESSEWPQVGDEAITTSSSLVVILGIDGNTAWVRYKDKPHIYNSLSISNLSKPKTPEEELRDLLHGLWDASDGDFDEFVDIAINYVIKKPQ